MDTGRPWELWIWEPGKSRPLAKVGDGRSASVSPDDRYLAVNEFWTGTQIFVRSGWDCPEAQWGLAVFPHVWLFVLSVMLCVNWYWIDFRRFEVLGGAGGVSLAMVLVGVGPFAVWLVSVLTSGWVWSGWPLVVVAGIGLGSGSRFWRVGALVLLLGAMVLQGWYGWLIWRGGVAGMMELGILDRTWEVGRGLVFGGRVLAAGVLGVGVVQAGRLALDRVR